MKLFVFSLLILTSVTCLADGISGINLDADLSKSIYEKLDVELIPIKDEYPGGQYEIVGYKKIVDQLTCIYLINGDFFSGQKYNCFIGKPDTLKY